MELVLENPTSLAWIGDAVFALRAREHLLKKGFASPGKLQKLMAKYASARGQSAMLEKMETEDQWFSEDEQEILRRGRNANVHTTAKNADRSSYMRATALEALLGYLYLYGHTERMNEILDRCMEIGDGL